MTAAQRERLPNAEENQIHQPGVDVEQAHLPTSVPQVLKGPRSTSTRATSAMRWYCCVRSRQKLRS
jgi:hypothetical protein